MSYLRTWSRKILSEIVRPNSTSTIKPVKLAYSICETPNSPAQQASSPLIVTHGIFGTSMNFRGLCKSYHDRTKRKVVAVDSRNHGSSPHSPEHTYDHMVADLLELLKELKTDRAAFFGHGMGGRTVLYLALKYPQLVDRLIMVDVSPVSGKGRAKSVAAVFNLLRKQHAAKSGTISKAQADLQLSQLIKNKKIRKYILMNLRKNRDGSYGWKVNIPVLLANFDTLMRLPEVGGLKFEGPVLFIGDDNSQLIPKDNHEHLFITFPKAEFKYIEAWDDWLIDSAKQSKFMEWTVEFLNRTSEIKT